LKLFFSCVLIVKPVRPLTYCPKLLTFGYVPSRINSIWSAAEDVHHEARDIMMRACFFALILSSLIVVGCQDDPVTLEEVNPIQDASFQEKGVTPQIYNFGFSITSQSSLIDRFQVSQEIEYEVFEWTYPEDGGAIMTGEIRSWAHGKASHPIGIYVPEGAIPAGYGDVDFKLSVPAYNPLLPSESQPPMVFILEPEGIQFNVPIQILMSYPPWLTSSASLDVYEVFCLHPQYSKDKELVGVSISDYQQIPPGEEKAPISNTYIFETDHFSTWTTNQAADDENTGGYLPEDEDGDLNELDNPINP
jgi:hypothetical protein